MGSWSYISGGKGFVCEESVARSRNRLMNWELSSPSSYVCSPQEGFVELGSQDLMRKAMDNNNNTSLSESLTSNSGFTAIRNAFSREDDSSSKLSISVVESTNSRDSSLIDLKLGGFPDHRDVQNIKSRAPQSSTPAKRLRAGGMNSQTPYCQVQGCKKDLSSCKDYHKRHKVCEVHSKTAKVIVNGIEQRFCQQCSRFHLLAEFDDGKRSCRKRLAGHNERRRKPHTGMHSGRTGRLLQSYPANRFQGTGFSTSSFVCQDILPGNLMHQQKYETNEWGFRNVKVEEGTDFSPQLAIPGQPEPKSVFASYNSEKHFPSPRLDVGISESSNSYLHDMAGPDFVPRYSLGSEVVLNAFDSSSTIPGISGISNSGRALSLLSSSSTHSLINPGTNEHYDMARVSRISSSEDARLQQMMLFSNTGQSYGMNPIVQGPDYMNVKSQISGEDGGPTIDLLQLSSQLQRVEHERHSSVQVKQESGAFSGLRIT